MGQRRRLSDLLFAATQERSASYSSFNGVIEEVRLWDTARSSGQIAATLNASLVGDGACRVGLWTFDEATG